MKPNLTITITGARASGKTTMATFISDILRHHKFKVIPKIPEVDIYNRHLKAIRDKGPIEIIEVPYE